MSNFISTILPMSNLYDVNSYSKLAYFQTQLYVLNETIIPDLYAIYTKYCVELGEEIETLEQLKSIKDYDQYANMSDVMKMTELAFETQDFQLQYRYYKDAYFSALCARKALMIKLGVK